MQNKEISVRVSKNGDDYISLTDMAKFKDPEATGIVIAHWLSSKYSVQFMGSWEQMFNPDFNVTEFSNIRNEVGSNGYILSSSSWIKKTNAIGIRSSTGRYGGTFAHKDIAFEFATWLSPEFKLYLIKEFQRLKVEENEPAGHWLGHKAHAHKDQFQDPHRRDTRAHSFASKTVCKRFDYRLRQRSRRPQQSPLWPLGKGMAR